MTGAGKMSEKFCSQKNISTIKLTQKQKSPWNCCRNISMSDTDLSWKRMWNIGMLVVHLSVLLTVCANIVTLAGTGCVRNCFLRIRCRFHNNSDDEELSIGIHARKNFQHADSSIDANHSGSFNVFCLHSCFAHLKVAKNFPRVFKSFEWLQRFTQWMFKREKQEN